MTANATSSLGSRPAAPIELAGAELAADPAGALYWPAERTLAVSDLHLEKGSSYGERRIFLPPYDTAVTLARLAEIIARYAPRLVIALGDNFHDRGGPSRMGSEDRDALRQLQRGRDWIWIAGNHDPEPAPSLGGDFADALALGPLSFQHAPGGATASGEIAGHLHPVARLAHRGCTVSRRCFASDGERMVMPAFGAFAGGLNVLHRAFGEVFGSFRFTAYLLGERRLYPLSVSRCAKG